jgi:hypothetical protein
MKKNTSRSVNMKASAVEMKVDVKETSRGRRQTFWRDLVFSTERFDPAAAIKNNKVDVAVEGIA